MLLSDAIFNKYTTIYENPTFWKTNVESGDVSGLYKSTDTNKDVNGEYPPTYYFRGNVENYIDFAGFIWRVVRINEDGTIRIIMQNGINDDANISYNLYNNAKKNIYYSDSNAKSNLENWYQTNIVNKGFSANVATGDYYCQQAKVAYNSTFASSVANNISVYDTYKPNFKCSNDSNGYGIVNSNIGLISYDEVFYAGGYVKVDNNNYYLYNGTSFWMMSPMSYWSGTTSVWFVKNTGIIDYNSPDNQFKLRPVINLKSNVTVTGIGASDDHWVVQ